MILLLHGNSQRLAAGHRTLALTWSGGTPLFTIRLDGPHTTPSLAITSSTRTATFDPFGGAIGDYQVTIVDATGEAANSAFTVVDRASHPVRSAEAAAAIESPSTPPSLAAALDAARLMADPSGNWRFEAYQRLIGHEAGSVLARRLVYELETGG